MIFLLKRISFLCCFEGVARSLLQVRLRGAFELVGGGERVPGSLLLERLLGHALALPAFLACLGTAFLACLGTAFLAHERKVSAGKVQGGAPNGSQSKRVEAELLSLVCHHMITRASKRHPGPLGRIFSETLRCYNP